MSLVRHQTLARLLRVLALAGFVVFLAKPFRTGWTHSATDFPNYYTAAIAVRHGESLHHLYDWTWFARQLNYAGFDRQLGAYTPQTPLTMLPMLGLAGQSPQTAKRIWLAINLVLLLATFGILARVTQFRWEQIALPSLCGFGSLSSNFIYGQYYVFLLFLMTLLFYWLHREKTVAGGVLCGVAFGLKLYTGPLLLYFAAKRNWRTAGAMVGATLGMAALAVALFGWAGVQYYLTQVLPRTLEGGSIDPYHPGNATLSTLLRRMFVREPSLNPNPILEAPWLFFFSRAVLQLGLLASAVLAVAHKRETDIGNDFSWFVVLLILLSTSTASYTYILLLLPTALLLKDASVSKGAFLIGCYILLNANLGPIWLFPKLWLLLLLFVVVGKLRLSAVPRRWMVAAGTFIVLAGLWDARRHLLSYAEEPGRRYPQIGSELGTLFSGYPAVSKFGLFYQCTGEHRDGDNRYVLCRQQDRRVERISFEGQALHPVTSAAGDVVWFELVENRRSTMMRLDPLTGLAVPSTPPAGLTDEHRRASPDGKWIIQTQGAPGSQQIWLRNAVTEAATRLAGGSCDNTSPVWALDSSAIFFASDCGRAFGLPALYRAPISQVVSER